MTKIDNAGVPSLMGATPTETTAAAVAASIVTPTPPASSFGQIVSDILAGIPEEAVVLVCPTARRVIAGSGAVASELSAAITGIYSPAGKNVVLEPDADQSGVTLTWNKADGANATTEIKAIAATVTTAAKPKRSVSSVVSAILAASYAGDLPCLLIDQVNGNVTILGNTVGQSNNEEDLLDEVEGIVDYAKAIDIHLTGTDNEVNQPTTKLIFEGGDVPA